VHRTGLRSRQKKSLFQMNMDLIENSLSLDLSLTAKSRRQIKGEYKSSPTALWSFGLGSECQGRGSERSLYSMNSYRGTSSIYPAGRLKFESFFFPGFALLLLLSNSYSLSCASFLPSFARAFGGFPFFFQIKQSAFLKQIQRCKEYCIEFKPF